MMVGGGGKLVQVDPGGHGGVRGGAGGRSGEMSTHQGEILPFHFYNLHLK